MICHLINRLFRRRSRLTPLLFFFIVLTSHRSAGQCGVLASLTGSSFSNNNSIGGSNSWSSASNVGLSDNNYADNRVLLGALGTATTNYFVVKNFGFSLPSSASICGIEVTIERRATGISILHTVKDNSIRLVKNNIISGDDLASGSNWPGSDESAVYGSVSETWGSSWTAADINAANFGVAISAKF